MANRVAGAIFFLIDGVQQNAKGSFSYNLGQPKRDPIIGSDLTVHGYRETGQAPMIEGVITDRQNLNVMDLLNLRDATVTLELANGKSIVQRGSFYSHEGGITTEEAEIPVQLTGVEAYETGVATT